MKIAILTLPLHTNYGGILQAYALQTVLQRMGHEVDIVQKDEKFNSLSDCDDFIRFVKKSLFSLINIVRKRNLNKDKTIRQNTNRFISEHINLRLMPSIKEVGPHDYDAIVVGSDQIWRRTYYKPEYKPIMLSINSEDAFLKFSKGWNIKRIAYAASLGVDNWEYSISETKSCADLLKHFNAVSLRESSGVNNCLRYLKRKAELVLDPTMLLNKDDYDMLVDSLQVFPSNQYSDRLFCYILDMTSNKERVINKISQETGLKCFFMTGDATGTNIQPPVEAWIDAIRSSSLIVTDSFHACVFSIIFNKPFIAIGNRNRGLSRFNSLLGLFNLEHRLIDENSVTYPSFKIADYDNINEILGKWRVKSLDFLSKALTK